MDNTACLALARQATDDNLIWRKNFTWWISKVTDKHKECATLTAFTLKQCRHMPVHKSKSIRLTLGNRPPRQSVNPMKINCLTYLEQPTLHYYVTAFLYKYLRASTNGEIKKQVPMRTQSQLES